MPVIPDTYVFQRTVARIERAQKTILENNATIDELQIQVSMLLCVCVCVCIHICIIVYMYVCMYELVIEVCISNDNCTH